MKIASPLNRLLPLLEPGTLRAEFAGGLSVLGIALIGTIAVGYVQHLSGLGGYIPSVRLWLAEGLVPVGLLLLWPLRRWLRGGLFVLAAAAVLGVTLSPRHAPPPIQADPALSLKIVSFNVFEENSRGDALAKALVDAQADVVIIAEAAPLRPHLGELRAQYPYSTGCSRPEDACDLMVLSAHPLIAPEVHSLSQMSHNRMIIARIKLGGQSIALAAVHVIKPYFDSFGNVELARLTKLVRDMPTPRIVAGDFNAATWSPPVSAFVGRTQMRPAWPEAATWPVDFGIFGIPIDHIFASTDNARVRDLKSFGKELGSNHLGLSATVDIFAP